MFKCLANVVTDEDGATLVEYGMLIALIAAVCIVTIKALGTKVSAAFAAINTTI